MVMEGLVVAAVPVNERVMMPMFIYGTNAWFGEQPILNRKPTTFEYVSATSVQTLQLPLDSFMAALQQEQAFLRHLAKLMAWRSEMAGETLMLMKFGSSAVRVVVGLGLFSEALATQSERPPTAGLDGGLEIPVNQHLLAKLCGVSRTLLSEYLQHLALAGWIRIGYGRIDIHSLGTWQRMLRRLRAQPAVLTELTIEQLLAQLDQSAVT